jgi:hypothetical protein
LKSTDLWKGKPGHDSLTIHRQDEAPKKKKTVLAKSRTPYKAASESLLNDLLVYARRRIEDEVQTSKRCRERGTWPRDAA